MTNGRHIRILTGRVSIVYDYDYPRPGITEARVKLDTVILPFVGISTTEGGALEWLVAALVTDPVVLGALAEVRGD